MMANNRLATAMAGNVKRRMRSSQAPASAISIREAVSNTLASLDTDHPAVFHFGDGVGEFVDSAGRASQRLGRGRRLQPLRKTVPSPGDPPAALELISKSAIGFLLACYELPQL